MSINYKTEEYYKRFIELQEKLRKSEEERLKLEMKFNEMVRITREEEQMHYRKLRTQYKRFLEEDRRRQDRNERIIRSLERIDSRVSMLVAKTERFKLLRQQYQTFLDRVYRNNEMKSDLPTRTVKIDETKPRAEDSNDIVQTYLQNLSSNKLREMLKKEEEARAKLPVTTTTERDEKYNFSDLHTFSDAEYRPNYANTIADDIMNSIYTRNIPVNDSNKLKQRREFNNNISVTPVVPPNDSKLPTLKTYDELIGSCPTNVKKDEIRNVISGAEDTETDDFSESDEILYKNPTEFNKAKLQNMKEPERNKNTSDFIFTDPITTKNSSNTQPLKTRTANNIEFSVEKTSDESATPVESKYSLGDEHFVSNVTSLDDNVFDIIAKVDEISEKKIYYEKTPEVSTEYNTSEVKEEITQPVIPVSESNITSNIKHKVDVTEVEESKSYVDYEKSVGDTVEEKSLHEHNLQKTLEFETLQEPPLQGTVEENVKLSNDTVLQEQKAAEFSKNEIPSVEATQEDLGNNYQQQPTQEFFDEIPSVETTQEDLGNNYQQQPTQEFFENERQFATEANYEGSSAKDLLKQNVNEPAQQYDENIHSASYDEYNQPTYDANHTFQQFNESGQPIQHFDEQNQFAQNYDESGQLIGQYDENSSQPVIEYDEHGQPIQSFDQQSQLMQQYDEQGQPIQSFDQQGELMQQYDEHGQFLQHYDANAQYDEHGQLIPQYDDQGQLVQPYDDSGQHYDGQYVGTQQQYDENGQLVQNYDYSQDQPQYDENGQLLQQNFDDQQYYPQGYEENVEAVSNPQQSENSPVLQDNENSGGGETSVLKDQEEVKEENQDPKKSSNVMEMLDTDTESVKQDTKTSHDSDFDFSNG